MILHRAAAIVALGLAVSACGGGGGGGGIQTGTPTPPTTPPPPSPVTISITAPDAPGAGGKATPAFNFTSNPPPVGTSISLPGSVMRLTPTSASGSGGMGYDMTAFYRGTVTVNGVTYPVFDLTGVNLGAVASNVRGDGTEVTTTNGGKVSIAVATLNYTMLGAWTYTSPNGGPVYLGQTATGSLTPAASVPTTGSATYTGSGSNGGVVGGYLVPGGNNTITGGSLTGTASVNVNFSSGAVSGTLSNMTAKPISGGSVPWNNVTLNGSINRTNGATMNGTAAAGAAPAGAGSAGFSANATGNFAAAFYGPAYNEMGGSWTLYESTSDGGKAAYGTFAGTR